MPIKKGHVVMSQSTCRLLMLVCRCSIPAFLWLKATYHIVKRSNKVITVAKPTTVREERKQSRQGGTESGR